MRISHLPWRGALVATCVALFWIAGCSSSDLVSLSPAARDSNHDPAANISKPAEVETELETVDAPVAEELTPWQKRLAEAKKKYPVVTTAEEYLALLEDPPEYIFPELSSIETQIMADRLRERFPMVSLRKRLAFQDHRTNVRLITDPREGKVPGQKLWRKHNRDDNTKRPRMDHRAHAFRRLHSEEVAEFISSSGFGHMRMIPPTPRNLRLRSSDVVRHIVSIPVDSTDWENETVSLPVVDIDPDRKRPQMEEADRLYVDGLLSRNLLGFLHHDFGGSFAASWWTGYIRDIDHVAGFQPHHIALQKTWSGLIDKTIVPDSYPYTDWKINRLQLVSLLMHDGPVAYETDRLPDMALVGEVPTRPLSDFETAALDKLRSGEELEVLASRRHILMLGALRADKHCMECHRAREGELLGAFSYELVRVGPLTDQPGVN